MPAFTLRFAISRAMRHPDGRLWTVATEGSQARFRVFYPDDGEWSERVRAADDPIAAVRLAVERLNEQRDDGFVDDEVPPLAPLRADGVDARAFAHPDGRQCELVAEARLFWRRDRDASGQYRDEARVETGAIDAHRAVVWAATDLREAGFSPVHPAWEHSLDEWEAAWKALDPGFSISPYLNSIQIMPVDRRERLLEAIHDQRLVLLSNADSAVGSYLDAPYETAFGASGEGASALLRDSLAEAHPLLVLALRASHPPLHRTRDQLWRTSRHNVSARAAELLSQSRSPGVMAAYLSCLAHPDPSGERPISPSYVRALLGGQPPDATTLAALVALTRSPDVEVALTAASVLAEFGDEPAALDAVWSLRDHRELRKRYRFGLDLLRLAETSRDQRLLDWIVDNREARWGSATLHHEWVEHVKETLARLNRR